MKDSREEILRARAELKKNLEGVKILPASSFPVSNKRDSLSENIKTQEQADLFIRQLRWLIRDAEEKERAEEQQNKK